MTSRARTGIVATAAIALLAGPLASQSGTEEAEFADLVRAAARESAAATTGSVRLAVMPEDGAPMVEQIFAEEFSAHGARVVLRDGSADADADVDLRDMRATAVPLDKSSYLRVLSLRLGVLVRRRSDGALVFTREFDRSRRDTLDGAPPYAERDFRLPEDRTWIDTVLAPVVAVSATIVIAVLLFTVRGS